MTSIIITLLIVFCKVPLIHIMGDKGIGYYSTAFVIYLLIMTCTAYGMPKAASSILAAQSSKGQYRLVYKTVQSILIFSFVSGTIASVFTFINAEVIAGYIMSAELSVYAIRSFAPCIFMISIAGALHGIFIGTRVVQISKIAYIIEEVFATILSVLGALYFSTHSPAELNDAYSAMGGAFGLTCGVTITCIFMLIFLYGHYKKLYRFSLKDNTKIIDTYWQIIKNIIISMLPFILTLIIFHMSSFTDYAVFNRIMKVQGNKESEYIEFLGILNGKYELFITIPLIIVNWYAARKTSILTQVIKSRNRRKLNKVIGSIFRYTMLFIIPCTVLFSVYSHPFMNLLFAENNELASFLLKTGAVSIIFYSLTVVSNAALNAMNEWRTVTKNAFVSTVIQLICLLIMMIVFEWEILAVVFSRIIFSASFYIFNEHSLRESAGYVQEKKRTFSIPFTSALIMSVVSFVIYFVANLFLEDRFALLIAIPFALLVYIMSMVVLGGISHREMYALPGVRHLAPLCKKLHLIE